ncbi:alpha-ribazole phosphatase family protein [Rhodobacter sp. NTK016B]|uniref:alpha-ribazole phosphatase family protein n=1 Tax=Rhodobacter sp. NTK016B TaxID=2759676 RepID=UPI001A8EE36A|nr:alpha-ribazole phosphatase family protein [Rhodobacter sp. NTK016B]MBN8291542.1 alpha-ribazole phosphatase family protein [Rhodobacter sp. NTK016B]
MSVILLRHTKPDVIEGTCYGRTDLGLRACFDDTAIRIAAELPPVERILSSPLSRCQRLAHAIAEARGLPVETDARFVEMDFGRWEGIAWSEIPRPEIDAWRDDFLDARPHGGESVRDLRERTRAGLDAVVEGPVPALVVTHAGVIKAALALSGQADGWDAQTEFGHWRRLAWPAP